MPMPRADLPTKNCERCGTPFERKMVGDRLEDAGVYRRKKYCSLTCANSRDTVKAGTHHWRAQKHRKAACEACGLVVALHVHHCDGNPRNNDPTNLQTLCTHCHNFWHHMLSRRGLPIAGRMPRLVSDGKTA